MNYLERMRLELYIEELNQQIEQIIRNPQFHNKNKDTLLKTRDELVKAKTRLLILLKLSQDNSFLKKVPNAIRKWIQIPLVKSKIKKCEELISKLNRHDFSDFGINGYYLCSGPIEKFKYFSQYVDFSKKNKNKNKNKGSGQGQQGQQQGQGKKKDEQKDNEEYRKRSALDKVNRTTDISKVIAGTIDWNSIKSEILGRLGGKNVLLNPSLFIEGEIARALYEFEFSSQMNSPSAPGDPNPLRVALDDPNNTVNKRLVRAYRFLRSKLVSKIMRPTNFNTIMDRLPSSAFDPGPSSDPYRNDLYRSDVSKAIDEFVKLMRTIHVLTANTFGWNGEMANFMTFDPVKSRADDKLHSHQISADDELDELGRLI